MNHWLLVVQGAENPPAPLLNRVAITIAHQLEPD